MTLTADTDLARRLAELDAKVDRLTDLIERQEVSRAATADLVAEAGPILRSAYESVAERLDERSIDVDSLASLLLRVGEMAPDLERLLDTLESASGLIDEVGALSGDAMARVVASLDELDRRGYFTWIKGGAEVVDRIITSFDEDDIAALGDNVVLIFETIKEMTQPDVMRMLQRSARLMREDAEVPEKISLFRLFREMRDPDVKLGIHRMLTMLRGMAMADETELDQIETETETENTEPEKERR